MKYKIIQKKQYEEKILHDIFYLTSSIILIKYIIGKENKSNTTTIDPNYSFFWKYYNDLFCGIRWNIDWSPIL